MMRCQFVHLYRTKAGKLQPCFSVQTTRERFASNTSIAESCFIAAFQMEFQREIHCTTAYGFKLVTLLVADNFMKIGQPIAWMVSNRKD